MRWTEVAIQDLKKYEFLKNSVVNISEKTKALEDDFVGQKGAITDRAPIQGGTSHREDFLLNNIVERERLALTLKSNKRLIAVIERGLRKLNKTELRVLDLFFIRKRKDHVKILCEELNLEQAQIYRIKNEALYKFTTAMYGIEEY